MKKIAKLSGFIVAGAVFFIGGFYIGFNNVPEVEKVYGISNKENLPEDISDADFADFWKAWNLVNERHPKGSETSSQEKIWGAIKGMVESVGDPYTYFFTPEEAEDLNIDLSGEFYGVGMEVGIREGNLMVISPIKDSPAEKAGIEAGDIILKIGEEIANKLTVDKAVDLIRGEKGTAVKLTILREKEETPVEISIIRDLVKIPTLETEHRKDGVFVISLFDFSRNSELDFEKALDEFVASGSDDLLIDLRGNPGGYLGSAINITSWFLEEGKTIVIEKSTNAENNNNYRSNGNFLKGDFDVVILVDGGSASASEIMAGAMQEHGVAKLVGAQTFGKGSVQELINFKDKTELKLTVAEWLTPNGLSISKNGLTPDVVVEFDEEAFKKNKTDNQLDAAVKVLLK
ncbi:MAG: carboxyl-terminal processing protease [Patescibacteria group bacterium]|nr:carboxyl-terminal processing protease [Patescibacteria group bacterium]